MRYALLVVETVPFLHAAFTTFRFSLTECLDAPHNANHLARAEHVRLYAREAVREATGRTDERSVNSPPETAPMRAFRFLRSRERSAAKNGALVARASAKTNEYFAPTGKGSKNAYREWCARRRGRCGNQQLIRSRTGAGHTRRCVARNHSNEETRHRKAMACKHHGVRFGTDDDAERRCCVRSRKCVGGGVQR